jgi:hypothetical protein
MSASTTSTVVLPPAGLRRRRDRPSAVRERSKVSTGVSTGSWIEVDEEEMRAQGARAIASID